MAKAKDPVLDALRQASKGLSYTSETDAEFEPFAWANGKLTRKHLLELAGAEKGTAVEQTSLEDFFGAVPEEDREKFQALAKGLRAQLTGIKEFKLGGEAGK